jgi:hypothetical protein
MRPRTWYGWAEYVDFAAVSSDAARDGLAHAKELAATAADYREEVRRYRDEYALGEIADLESGGPRRKPIPPSVSDLAEVAGVSASTIRKRIALAKREAFPRRDGRPKPLSDRQIYERIKSKQFGSPILRVCKLSSCSKHLRSQPTGRPREFCCDSHRQANHRGQERLPQPRPSAAQESWDTMTDDERAAILRAILGEKQAHDLFGL